MKVEVVAYRTKTVSDNDNGKRITIQIGVILVVGG